MCRFIDVILERKPSEHIFNVGNAEAVSIREWVEICYHVAGKQVDFVNVDKDIEQRNYFSFYNYEYYIDVSRQYERMSKLKLLCNGLGEAFEWYIHNPNQVNKKPLIDFIDSNLA